MRKLGVFSGGTKGIGKAIIEKFAAQGWDVATCSRNLSDLERLKKEWEGRFPGIEVHVAVADLSHTDEAKAFSDFVLGLDRPVHLLVNNAGQFVPSELCTGPEGDLDDMLKANLMSAYYLTRGLVPHMKTRREGHIVNMCSVASIKGYPNGGAYSVSKTALLGFSRTLREELKPFNIRVTSIMPGAVRTQSWDGVDLPEERFMKPEDVAEMVYVSHSLSGRSVVEEIILRPFEGDI